MFFSLFTGNVVLEFVNQFHFNVRFEKRQQKRAAAIAIKLYWIGREYN